MTGRRVGIVLAGGGSVGVAYHGAILAALEEATGWDPRLAEVIVGTSAGSITGAMVRAGLPASDLARISEGAPLSAEGRAIFAHQHRPHRPRPSLALPRPPRPDAMVHALVDTARNPFRRNIGALAAFLPEGVISTRPLTEGFDRVYDGRWPTAALWLCAVRLRGSSRVVFGAPGAPTAPVGLAVGASCAIPGHFAPVVIAGERYVDGGAHSMANLDLVEPLGLDLVIVSSPMTGAPGLRPDALLRRALRARLAREADRLRRQGTEVVLFEPERDDLAAMGLNPMDVRRRLAVSRQARSTALRRLDRGDLQGLLGGLAA